MFPDVRLSQLSRERSLRRDAFEESRARFMKEAKERARPLNLVRENPKLAMGAVMWILSGFGLKKLGSFAAAHNGNGNRVGYGKRGAVGWMAKLAGMGGGIALTTLKPFAAATLRFAVKSLFRRLRNRR